MRLSAAAATAAGAAARAVRGRGRAARVRVIEQAVLVLVVLEGCAATGQTQRLVQVPQQCADLHLQMAHALHVATLALMLANGIATWENILQHATQKAELARPNQGLPGRACLPPVLAMGKLSKAHCHKLANESVASPQHCRQRLHVTSQVGQAVTSQAHLCAAEGVLHHILHVRRVQQPPRALVVLLEDLAERRVRQHAPVQHQKDLPVQVKDCFVQRQLLLLAHCGGDLQVQSSCMDTGALSEHLTLAWAGMKPSTVMKRAYKHSARYSRYTASLRACEQTR